MKFRGLSGKPPLDPTGTAGTSETAPPDTDTIPSKKQQQAQWNKVGVDGSDGDAEGGEVGGDGVGVDREALPVGAESGGRLRHRIEERRQPPAATSMNWRVLLLPGLHSSYLVVGLAAFFGGLVELEAEEDVEEDDGEEQVDAVGHSEACIQRGGKQENAQIPEKELHCPDNPFLLLLAESLLYQGGFHMLELDELDDIGEDIEECIEHEGEEDHEHGDAFKEVLGVK
eukprot:CAMPEP_0170552948 /NCGR_PEP_ID=MMETSP0211-20121228/10833_1 /TAXON_ID=311385 /ORGANISM="Pseudokeronopsis sp., Strain OXSARD2" /LENGTH=227 /DNA_ID=CAMNT_0010861023 /DNA_START=64 /DNA_END=746 /DNA_ORIENTATION=-